MLMSPFETTVYPRKGVPVQLNESNENYLERMLMIQQERGQVRSVDVATAMGVSRASVSHATKLLRENNYITMGADGVIELLPAGLAIAEKMLDRHQRLARFLMALGVDEHTALEDACKMEHDLSPASYEAICRHADGMKRDG